MLDWDDLKVFLAIVRHGNLSAAGRALKLTQTTMGRRLEALHARAGARLLQKTPTGYVLTTTGERILASAERIEAEVLSIERSIRGEDVKIAGKVRISTVEVFGARVLTPMLRPLGEDHPELLIEVIADRRSLSLARREADIALRLSEFEQNEVVASRVGDFAYALFASRDYLAERGEPDFDSGAPGHDVIALEEDQTHLPQGAHLAALTSLARTALRTNSCEAQFQAAVAGYGIAMLPRLIGRQSCDLVELPAKDSPVVRGIWLGVHRDLRHMPRMRLVMDYIANGLKRIKPTLV